MSNSFGRFNFMIADRERFVATQLRAPLVSQNALRR